MKKFSRAIMVALRFVFGAIFPIRDPRLAGRNEIETVVASTVLLSVLLHGITAAPLSDTYARRVQGMAADAPEKQGSRRRHARAPPRPLLEAANEATRDARMEGIGNTMVRVIDRSRAVGEPHPVND